MSKGRIIFLLIVTFFIMMGWPKEAQAQIKVYPEEQSQIPDGTWRSDEWASSCSSILVSTPLCDEFLTQSCIGLQKEPEIPQIQSSVIIYASKEAPSQSSIQTQPETLTTPTPTQSEPVPQESSLDSDRIFDLINQHRASQGLTPFELEASVCELAQERSTELAGELVNGTIHSGLYNRNLPYWIWENAKVGSSEDETVAWWLSSPLHHQSIVGDYKYSCAKCQGTNCTQLFTSFVAK